jgi:hypothetical protein
LTKFQEDHPGEHIFFFALFTDEWNHNI